MATMIACCDAPFIVLSATQQTHPGRFKFTICLIRPSQGDETRKLNNVAPRKNPHSFLPPCCSYRAMQYLAWAISPTSNIQHPTSNIQHHTIGHLNLLFSLIFIPVVDDFLAASIISSTCNACSALIRGSIPFINDSPTLVAPSCH